MRRALWGVLIALAVLIDGFFALVNFYPVAPKRDRGAHLKVLVSLDASQAKWLSESLISEFNDEHASNVELEVVADDQLLPTLGKEKDTLLLAALPRAQGKRAIDAKDVQSFADAIPNDALKDELDQLAPKVVESAQVDGKPYFLPRAALLDIMVYRVSRVRDAVRHWSLLRKEIDAALTAQNGHGLPPGYALELAPESWDSYDRFVVAYYWAHRRYDGMPARGRVGHRVGPELDEVVESVEAAYRAGATDADVDKLDGKPQHDALAWEKLYRQLGLYSPAMLAKPTFDDDAVLSALRTGDLYVATVTQMQAFALHGGSHRGTPPRIGDPDDLAFAPLTRVSSLELGADGHPLRHGRRFSFREDWVWMLPVGSPSPALAFDLITFLQARDQHYRECEALGMIPLRQDVMRERSSLFKLPWMSDILDASFDEWKDASPVPERIETDLGQKYVALWQSAVTSIPAPRAPAPAPTAVGTIAELDEDEIDESDDELWRGKVALEPEAESDREGDREGDEVSELDPQKPHLADIAAAVESAIERLDARTKADQALEKAKASAKERLSDRVSIAAIALTMLLSFLGFARGERDDSGKQLRVDASKAEREADANWTLFHARNAERDGYVRAEDELTREVAGLGDEDPRLRLAQLNHVEYAAHISAIDNENRHVFFVIEDLDDKQIRWLRAADHIDDKIARYDMGTRVLTLALIILSVTLLANQRHLFSAAVALAFIGAGIAISGYLMP